ncbi:1-deoxy-D-xylulose-5-phosphate synthase [Alcanivorax sp. HI0033]|uniref:1-deoxy-D-xylulose-5-phosphate synthase n=1 Tax=unclassified Alcanivorax TaxID=2638842 RepID=UPI0007B88CA2|nr:MULTISPECIES: 1-deoxy-D-xylulose-5-phosphate synthase [unclassified Alcanivorax]KZX76102.1 1-deoxy-D-xylulose-5-phosphate synthase [Alcanivorax sp. HI0013]KZX77980.1 1-deoxy-D-xylulose-5-phosphate synthase [Alcanivorax sp. HI0011]KZY10622.1 1-deoxy-D-xylulose-5-phosphate synthase [Alcanivorax sp. HI0035]KZX60851.1 1-deoxy-D-xylulose-5-phosphate synthase [Alcanivorax sp. HI0003]KZX66180.1 1-deoxy-D-xylulose-5-phosphate synthase [Alcanivorax sp. HI0007]
MPKTFTQIPLTRPATPLLDTLTGPAELRRLPATRLEQVVDELREYLLYAVGQCGGHFGAGLGVVELTVALHYLYNTPDDRLVWDVGHQCYPHKILTGRREGITSIRQQDGLSGFPKRSESEYDTFGVGHSSTSISAALGMALGAEMAGSDRRAVAIIGDGAMTAGQAFEAMSHAAHTRSNLLVILNDNNMSISHNVGGLSNYFARIWASKSYIALREGGKKVLSTMPAAWDFIRRTEESMKNMVSPDMLFEAIGFNYIGPIDGHNVDELVRTLGNMRALEGPQLLHIYTTKGKGFAPAEADPVGYHAINKIEPKPKVQVAVPSQPKKPKYQDIFGQWLCDMAAQDKRLVGITPAMCEGSGMVEFSRRFPDRFHDVAICEQHAVTLAGGLACENQKPVVAIYSTFLQRGYDQLIHDVALQDLDVTFALDRAGLVGEDGATHGGVFDLAYLRTVPNMIIAAPSDENECRQLLSSAYQHEGPAAVRYPRGTGPGVAIEKPLDTLPIGQARTLRDGQQVAILAFGALTPEALDAGKALNATVLDMRWVKPLDRDAILKATASHTLLVTVEDHQRMGGAGSAVNELLHEEGLLVDVLNLALPDHFIHHGKRDALLAQAGLDAEGIETQIRARLSEQQRLREAR